MKGYETNIIVIVYPEHFLQFLLLVPVLDLLGHQRRELIFIYGTRAILVHLRHHLLYLFSFQEDAQCLQGILELVNIDTAGLILIEEREGVLDLVDLLLRKRFLYENDLLYSSSTLPDS